MRSHAGSAGEVAREHGGAGVATLIGERDKVSVSQAIIANETMVRYLDFNDVLYFLEPGQDRRRTPERRIAGRACGR